MYSREELKERCADMLKNLREESGMSKAAIARRLMMDDHTWARYESGQSAPTVPEMIYIYSHMKRDILVDVLKYLYPEVYDDLSPEDIKSLRNAISHFFLNIASDLTCRQWGFLMFGGHGSNSIAQMQEFCMIDHLPMRDRVAVAQLVSTLYQLAEAKGELVCTDHVMPDIELFKKGVLMGTDAAKSGSDSYTIASLDQQQI